MKFLNKGRRLMLLTIIMLCANMIFGQTQDTLKNHEDFSELEITSMLKEFSVSYIKENIKEHPSIEKIDLIRRKYCTLSLINQYGDPESNFDSIIHTQIFEEELFNSINVKKSSLSYDIYYVTIMVNKAPITIKTRIVKDKNIYKLDYIFINEYNEIQE